MRDFPEIVRKRLGRLPLGDERADEIAAELAHQLEDTYKEALAGGVAEPLALAGALEQFGDWKKLRHQVVSAERGETMLWPHPKAMPRSVSWAALAIVAALCLIPGFRQAMWSSPAAWTGSVPQLPEKTLRDLAAKGVRDHDARLVAFAALHLEDRGEASGLAEQAAGMDPSFTWIGTRFAYPRYLMKDSRVDGQAWIARVEAWDPENAVPHLLAADQLLRSIDPAAAEGSLLYAPLLSMSEGTPWAEKMKTAFASPRYDDYMGRAFELNRSVLSTVEGTRTGDSLWWPALSIGFPHTSGLLGYSGLISQKLGPEAENAKRYDDAAKLYSSLTVFGARMASGVSIRWERATAWQVQAAGYEKLASLYERTGRKQEAAAITLQAQTLQNERAATLRDWNDVARAHWISSQRSATLAWFAAWLVMLFGSASAIWALLLGFRSAERVLGGWAGAVAFAMSYAPVLFLASSVSLFGAMWPYLHTAGDYSTAPAMFADLGPFWFSYWGGWDPLSDWHVYFQHMLWPVVFSAFILIAGMIALRWMARHRALPSQQAE